MDEQKVMRNYQEVNLDNERLLIEYRDQLDDKVVQILKLENQVSDCISQMDTFEKENKSLSLELTQTKDIAQEYFTQLSKLQKDLSEIQKTTEQFDRIENDFKHSLSKLEEQDLVIKNKESMIKDLRKQLQEDLMKYNTESRQFKKQAENIKEIEQLLDDLKTNGIQALRQSMPSNIKLESLTANIGLLEEQIVKVFDLSKISDIDSLTFNKLNQKIRGNQKELSGMSQNMQKAVNTEQQLTKQVKEYKKLMSNFKTKMLELEGIAQNYKIYEKQMKLETSKKEKNQDIKDREILQLKDKIKILEEKSFELEKKYSKVNPNRRDNQYDNSVNKDFDIDDINQLKAHVYKQDEEIFVLKDMLKSATLQNKMKDSEIKKLKSKLKVLGVDYQSSALLQVKNSNLPDIKIHNSDQDTNFGEPSKLDKLNELSLKFRRQQKERDKDTHITDVATQTDPKQAKSIAIQSVKVTCQEFGSQTAEKLTKDMQAQTDSQPKLLKKAIDTQTEDVKIVIEQPPPPKIIMLDKSLQYELLKCTSDTQTDTIAMFDKQTQILILNDITYQPQLFSQQIRQQQKPKQKRIKPQNNNGGDESEYEYYEEEVEVTDDEQLQEELKHPDNGQPVMITTKKNQ
eukprot:403377341